MENQKFTPPAPQQIEEWKKKHKRLHQFTLTGTDDEKLICIVRHPKLTDVDAAMSVSKKTKSDLAFTRTLLDRIKLACDPKIEEDEDYLSTIYGKIDELWKKVECELKEL